MFRVIATAISFSTLLTSGATAADPQDLHSRPMADAFVPAKSWHGVAEVSAAKDSKELTAKGEGTILINGLQKDKTIPYLVTQESYGDVKVEIEFMVPKGSNAGVYLMGRYEVQILDSYGRKKFGSGDLGGIYQQWDPSKPEGQQGFGGIKPKVNAAKPPGEWQTMEITFRAPRFSFDGKKIKDATFEKVAVNGVTVQENATASGHTRSAPLEGESVLGPIAIQGDHGPIAIKRYQVTRLDYPEETRLQELNDYWLEVSRSVREGDHKAYVATCHDSAVIIAGNRGVSYPLADALARWKKEFDTTRDGTRKSNVEFRFSTRYGDATTAYEKGLFKYTWSEGDMKPQSDYLELEALLTKENNRWEILMEYQKAKSSKEEWDKLEAIE